MTWTARCELASGTAAHLRSADPAVRIAAMGLVRVLAEDPKWEVRKAVADALPAVASEDFAKLAARLSADANSYVRGAAERSVAKRRTAERRAAKSPRAEDQVAAICDPIRQKYGDTAANHVLRAGEKYFDLLVGEARHNVMRVLTPLLASARVILDHPAGLDPVISEAANRLNERALLLQKLLDDMQAYARPIPEQRDRGALADVVADARTITHDHLAACGWDCSAVNLSVGLPSVVLSMARHQIVMATVNILQNAYESFATSGRKLRAGEIKIDGSVLRDRVEVVVLDNGSGIAEEDLCLLRQFIPRHSTKPEYGTGFGLPIAKRYIDAHGGTLNIDSREGEGTSVAFTLPISDSGVDEG
jgi:signal transduction histidine kinase